MPKSRTSGGRPHKPAPNERVSTHVRITQGGAEALANIDIDEQIPVTHYDLPLTEEAFRATYDFAQRAMLEAQYERWENAVQAGADPSNVPVDSIITDEPYQEIYLRLLALQEVVNVALGGIHTVYDTSDSEIITVLAAHGRGYTSTFLTGAADSDLFIVVHVLPDTALLDATYGNDISHDTDFHGKLAVFGGKVVRDVPALDLQPSYNGTLLPVVNTANSDVLGSWNTTTFGVPAFVGSSNPPCNDCINPSDPPNPPPPPPPPPPPTGGGLPTLPTQPTPNPSINADVACSTIFEDIGYDLTAFFELISVSFKAYGNTPIASTYPASLSAAIHTWISTFVTDFDFTCDSLQNIKLKLLVSLTDNGIFGFIPNPFPSNSKTPTILSIESTSPRIYQDIYYFPIDRKQIEDVISGVGFPTYQENFYEQTHTIAIRAQDKINGNVGFEKLAFGIDAGDYITGVSVTPLQLQMCGISYKKHQYLFHFGFDGQDPVKIISGTTYIYDIYENGRHDVPTGYFESGGFTINTDAVHGFFFGVDMLCGVDTAATTAAIYGSIQCTHNHWGTTNLVDLRLNVYAGGTQVGVSDQAIQVDQALGVVQFALTATGTFVVGTTYQFALQSSSFPDDTYVLYNLTGYLS